MEQLLEDYKRKLETIKQMIADDNVESESTLERLKTKQGMIRSFIIDIDRAMADTNTGDSGLHLQRVSGSASDFYTDLMKLINAYCDKGLKKPDLVHKMEYATESCKLS